MTETASDASLAEADSDPLASAEDPGVLDPAEAAAAVEVSVVGSAPAVIDDAMPDVAGNALTDALGAQLAALAASVQQLAAEVARHHARAEHRESVIDGMHAELDRLRDGERRGMLRPLLTELCRLRGDLLRQANELPVQFDASAAARLLQSYADSIEIALEDNGVASFQPDVGDAFDARAQRTAGRDPAPTPDLVGAVARVRKAGYRDLESGQVIAPAEVVLFVAPAQQSTSNVQPPPPTPETLPGSIASTADDTSRAATSGAPSAPRDGSDLLSLTIDDHAALAAEGE